MPMTLYELCGRDDRRFSPYCWRTRLALAHKGLDYDTVPVRFADKAPIAFSGQDRVPVLRDGDHVVSDSWAIACDLEARYPDRPSLFGGAAGRRMTEFFNAWADLEVNMRIISLVVRDVFDRVDERDRDYFLETRQKRFGASLEKIHAARETKLPAVRAAFAPARAMLRNAPFFAGEAPAYADYILLGSLQWLRMTSDYQVLEPDDAILAWRDRLIDRLGPVFEGVEVVGP